MSIFPLVIRLINVKNVLDATNQHPMHMANVYIINELDFFSFSFFHIKIHSSNRLVVKEGKN